MVFNINTDSAVAYTNKLEKLRKTALPNAVRETLSRAAMDVKKRTMPAVSNKVFVNRQKNFFKAFSRVDFAKGKDLRMMKSAVGFSESGLRGANNNAVKELEQQEFGGKIGGRSFIAMDAARAGSSPNRLVKLSNRISELDDIINVSRRFAGKKRIKSKKQRWIRAAIMAKKLHGEKAFVLGNMKSGRRTLRRIDRISTNVATRKLEIKSTPVYSFKNGRSVAVKSTGFMRRAAHETAMNMDFMFIAEARKEIKRILNK